MKISKKYFNKIASGSTFDSISTKDIKNITLPKPIKLVQQKIVTYLNEKLMKIDKIIHGTKKSIDKYQEYKKSIIFEAVTGKIDLRDYEEEEGEDIVKQDNTRKAERESLSTVN